MHEVERTGTGSGALIVGVLQIYRQVWWPASYLAVAVALPITFLSVLIPTSTAPDRFSWLLTIVADGAIVFLTWQVLEGRERLSPSTAFGQSLQRWGAMVWATIISNLIVLLFMLLLIVPGIMRAMSYLLVLPMVLADRGRGSDALSSSQRWMQGRRMDAFVAGLALAIPPIVILVVYIIAVVVLETYYEQALSPVVWLGYAVDIVADILLTLSVVPLALLPAVLYSKLRRTEEAF